MPVIKITTIQEIDLDTLLEQFQKSWKTIFDGTKQSCCMLFEELTFGQHMNPSTAQQIVEAVKEHMNLKNRTVLRIHPKGEYK